MKCRKMKGILLTAACLLAVSAHTYGAALYIYSDLNWANPAELNMIKKGQVILGTGAGILSTTYRGSSFGVSGVASRTKTDFLSYGQIAYRISPKTVIALAITQPVFADIVWGPNSFVSSTSVDTIVQSVNFAPRISYQLTPQLAIGAGLDLEWDYTSNIAFQVPQAQGGVIRNNFSGFYPRFDLGAFYAINPKTFLSASFYAPSEAVTRGPSTSSTGARTYGSAYFPRPMVVQLHLTRILTEKLLLSGGVYYSNWSAQNSIRLKNTVVGDLTFPNNWYDVWSFELGGKYDFNQTFSALFGGMYQTLLGPSQTNSVAYPAGAPLTLAAGVQVSLPKNFTARLVYAHIMYVPDARFTGPVDKGTMSLNLNVIAGRLTYDF